MQSTKALLLAVIGQGPRPYGTAAPPIVPSFLVEALCNLTVDIVIDTDSPAFGDGVFWAGLTGVITMTITNSGADEVSTLMPLEPQGLSLPYNWSSNFLVLSPGEQVIVTAEYVVTGAVGTTVSLDFLGCPEPMNYVIQYPNVFDQTYLNVMFMPGERHEGGSSDTEWVLASVNAVNIDGDGNETPDSMYFGQFDLNVGQHVKADVPIQLANGFYFHNIVARIPEGSYNIIQPVFSNRPVINDLSLDPATSDDFDAWWSTMPDLVVEYINDSGVVEYSVPMAVPGTPGSARIGQAVLDSGNPWSQSNKEKIVRARLNFTQP